jgi:hypothetical protein
MRPLNASIADIPLPGRMRWLPISDKGYPVPWFVEWIDGVPDFRVMDASKFVRAIKNDLCWLCGQTLGRFKCAVIGPMCAVNLTSAEPPSHKLCAEYAVRACPFLTKPKMRRNDKDIPGGAIEPGGIMLERNPGVTLLWIMHDYRTFRTPSGVLLRLGEPVEIIAYAEGRLATREELDASIASGLPALAKLAHDEGNGAVEDLAAQVERANERFKKTLKLAA